MQDIGGAQRGMGAEVDGAIAGLFLNVAGTDTKESGGATDQQQLRRGNFAGQGPLFLVQLGSPTGGAANGNAEVQAEGDYGHEHDQDETCYQGREEFPGYFHELKIE